MQAGQAPEIIFQVENITPSIARDYLTKNKTNNRKISPAVVRSYRTDMLAGNFKLTGDPIQFDVNGRMVNGQHRLEALAGIEDDSISIPIMVVRNVSEDAFRYMDNGWRRTAAQVAHTENIPYATSSTAIARLLFVYDTYGTSHLKSGTKHATINPTRVQVMDHLRANYELIQRGCLLGDQCRDLVMQSVTGFCYCLFYRKSGPSAETFFEHLRTGLELSENHPIYQLRKRLIANRAQQSKLNQTQLTALFVIAWNAFLEGRPMKRLHWKTGADFPSF